MNNKSLKWDAQLYNDKHSFVYDYGKALIDLLHPQKDERILDLGCGSGQLTAQIGELAKEVVGFDNSSEMVKDAKEKYDHIEFHVKDAAHFTFENKFDAIFSNAVLHWVTNYQGSIQSMYEALNPEGRIVLEFGGKGNVEAIVGQLRYALKRKGYEHQARLALWYFPSVGEYASALESVGFRVELAQHFDRPTELVDQESGVKDWLSMFCDPFFDGVEADHIEEIKNEVQENVRPICLIDGKWFADYKRLRIKAIKEEKL